MDLQSRTVFGSPPRSVQEAQEALDSLVMTWARDIETGQPVYVMELGLQALASIERRCWLSLTNALVLLSRERQLCSVSGPSPATAELSLSASYQSFRELTHSAAFAAAMIGGADRLMRRPEHVSWLRRNCR